MDTRNLVDAYKGLRVEDIATDMRKKSLALHIAIENLQHDMNIGSIVRTANAFNVASVHIVGKRHWNRRGAMATEKYLELHHHKSVQELKEWCQEFNIPIIGVDNVENSQSLAQTELPIPCMLVFGQEGPGLSLEMMDICEKIVAIEQYGSTRSINVAAAAAIAMHEWVRRNNGPLL